jgi:hypothetical protein
MTFGTRILGLDPRACLAAERENGVGPSFPEIDAITTDLVLVAFAGKRVATIEERDNRTDLELPSLTGTQRVAVANVFTLPEQQARGAWYLPEEGRLRPGCANLPYYFALNPRFASGASKDEKATVAFGDDPDALYYWAVLEPLFSALIAPFDLRGASPAKGDRAAQQQLWADVDAFYTAMAIDGGEPLGRIRYGSGWSALRSAEQLDVKLALLAQIRQSITADLGAHHRAWATASLVERFYAKAKKSPPLMRQVLTKPLQRVLSAYFGGDWLAFVSYLGEQPHPSEQLSTTLPEPRLYVEAATRVPDVAATHGVAPIEIERIISIFFGSETSSSPVLERVDVLRMLWNVVVDAHETQAPGMSSLWGLIEDQERISLTTREAADPQLHTHGLYRKRLPPGIFASIEDLWGGTMLTSYPDAIVSTVDPFARACATLGPALRFWNGLGLTAWFVAEGPMSRTDMKGAEKYYERELAALDAMACPVDRQLFADLIHVETSLGTPQPITEEVGRESMREFGIELVFSMSHGSRRRGFERLRDVVMAHWKVWSERHFEQYLRGLWNTELRETAREFNRMVEVRRKAPTLKQFAKHAADPTNRWFGGDVSQLYRALGEKCPATIVRRRALRVLPGEFAARVFRAIGGTPTTWEDLAKTIVGDDRGKQDHAWRMHQQREKLAELSIKYVQLYEALDRPPTLKEFGFAPFEYAASPLDSRLKDPYRDDKGSREERMSALADAWDIYSTAVQDCLQNQ